MGEQVVLEGALGVGDTGCGMDLCVWDFIQQLVHTDQGRLQKWWHEIVDLHASQWWSKLIKRHIPGCG